MYNRTAMSVEEEQMEPRALPRFSLLDARLTAARIDDVVDRVVALAQGNGKHYVCVFAADSLLKCRDNPELAEIANASDMTLCDGMPLVWVGRKIAKLDMNRCYGPDVMIKTIERGCAKGLRHFFYGCDCNETFDKLKTNLVSKFPDVIIAGNYVPPFRELSPNEKSEIVRLINDSKADCVWVGIGTPRQDFWIREFRPLVDAPVMLSVGAAFNFHAGTVRQAPRWMMRCGLEWLFRLMAEPRRLWRRYLIGNPRFLWLIAKQAVTKRPAPLGKVYDL